MFEIGNTLREARLRRGLDITECELGTKIRAKYLRAMEEEHFDLLPSTAYVRGFLRTYADYLGLDGQLVIDEYESRFTIRETGDADARRTRGRGRPGGSSRTRSTSGGSGIRPNRRRTETQLLWLAIGGVMSVALLIWMGVGNPSDSTPPLQGTGPIAESIPTADSDIDSTEAPEPLRITLAGVGPVGSYVEVHGRNAQGPQLFAGKLSDGNSKVFTVQQSLWVRTYNAEGLRVTVKGKARTMSGGTADFLISRTGITSAPASEG